MINNDDGMVYNDSIRLLELNLFDQCDEYYDCYIRTVYNPETDEYDVEWSEDTPFEIIPNSECYENCFVQVLTNTVTGEVSVGWIRGDE